MLEHLVGCEECGCSVYTWRYHCSLALAMLACSSNYEKLLHAYLATYLHFEISFFKHTKKAWQEKFQGICFQYNKTSILITSSVRNEEENRDWISWFAINEFIVSSNKIERFLSFYSYEFTFQCLLASQSLSCFRVMKK